MIRYALLGLLREQPDYGYSLRRRFEERLGPVWRLNSGQVYQSLRHLRRARLVDVVLPEQIADGAEPRERCVFAPTAKGERALERWLGSAPRGANARDETLLRLAVLGSTEPSRAAGLVEKRLRVLRKRVALLQGKAPIIARNGSSPIARRIAHEAALRHAEAHVTWLELAVKVLEDGSATDEESSPTGDGTADAAA
jgi:DNA-binding PadR family transcriptional regulator